MAFKNRKANYPLYETTVLKDIRDLVENAANNFPDRNALTYKKNPHGKEVLHFTYPESRDVIRSLGTEFLSMGYTDKKIAIVGEISPDWVFSYFSLMATGAVTVPIDKELPVADMQSIINTAECECVIFSAAIVEKASALRELCPTVNTYIQMWGDEAPDFAVSLESIREKGAEKFAAGDNSYYDYEQDIDKLASIVFTSGTTGKGKGVMLSVRNICSDMEQGMYNFQITYKTLCALPPHHTFGSTINLLGHYAQGCEIYLSSGLKYIVNELKEFKPTHLILVPLFVETFYKRIISTAEKQGKLDLLKKMIKVSNAMLKVGIDMRSKMFQSVTSNFGGKIEMIICGGAALNQDIIDFFEGIGITILNGYGITECAPLISCNRNEYRKNGSVGLPIIGGKVKILDPDENGEGEICYKGPNVMLGYYKDEEATAAAFDEEGYFKTGDYGKIELEGDDQWIYITGRLKNLIILSNGKNVYPEEIETDIQGIYGVSEVVVYAGESKKDPSKEVIVAEIFPDYDALKLRGIENIKEYFEEEMKKVNAKNVSYKSVNRIKLRSEEFPKNTSKKITRFVIDKSID